MSNESLDEEWTGLERKAIGALPRERAPEPKVEEALVAALLEQGIIRRRRPRSLLLAAAGAALVFACGWWLGTRSAHELPPQAKWMLLLHDQGTSAAPSREEMQERIREYSNWAHATASRGLIGGDKLADEGVLLSSAPSGVLSRALPGEGDVLGGYFLLDDMDESAALEIARGCPQLRHGGVVELRRIEP